MTEDAGFPAPELEPEAPAEVPEPDVTPAEAEPAEAVPEPAATPEEPTVPDPPTPDHVPPPFIPDQGVAGWLQEALLELHRRLRNLGG